MIARPATRDWSMLAYPAVLLELVEGSGSPGDHSVPKRAGVSPRGACVPQGEERPWEPQKLSPGLPARGAPGVPVTPASLLVALAGPATGDRCSGQAALAAEAAAAWVPVASSTNAEGCALKAAMATGRRAAAAAAQRRRRREEHRWVLGRPEDERAEQQQLQRQQRPRPLQQQQPQQQQRLQQLQLQLLAQPERTGDAAEVAAARTFDLGAQSAPVPGSRAEEAPVCTSRAGHVAAQGLAWPALRARSSGWTVVSSMPGEVPESGELAKALEAAEREQELAPTAREEPNESILVPTGAHGHFCEGRPGARPSGPKANIDCA